jgi:ornithine decarboxylase
VIVARAFSLIVRVLLRKGRRLYINDGIWASLSDSWTGKITLPARFIPDPNIRRRNGEAENDRAVQGLRRDLRFRRHPDTALLAAGNGRYRRLDRDRPYRRLFAVAAGHGSTGFIPTPSSRFDEHAFRRGEAPESFASLETMADLFRRLAAS